MKEGAESECMSPRMPSAMMSISSRPSEKGISSFSDDQYNLRTKDSRDESPPGHSTQRSAQDVKNGPNSASEEISLRIQEKDSIK